MAVPPRDCRVDVPSFIPQALTLIAEKVKADGPLDTNDHAYREVKAYMSEDGKTLEIKLVDEQTYQPNIHAALDKEKGTLLTATITTFMPGDTTLEVVLETYSLDTGCITVIDVHGNSSQVTSEIEAHSFFISISDAAEHVLAALDKR